ncbi:MAG: NFACT RNA binding domain-containing protein [Eubacteriales bacterium]|nr:NFACT RNA binding domain-containing protein [Eubacteriales bacterium]
MPLDAICLRAVVGEIAPQIEGARIEKIQQPARDQVILLLRGNRRLLLNAGANQPRIHLTKQLRDNPSQPPMFCMLLRKHLSSGRISAVEQEPLERVVTLHIDATDEMGEQSTFHLILEAMGRHSNLILTDRDNRIIDCMRRVDFEMSQERQVLPGLYYHLPPKQGKLSPLDIDKDGFLRLLSACSLEKQADSWLLDTFTAISPLVAREMVYRACGNTDARVFEVGQKLWNSFSTWQNSVKENCFTPIVIKKNKKYSDYSYMSMEQYDSYAEGESCDSFCEMLDAFYEGREQAERVRQKGQDLMKAATNARDRVRRKIALQEKEYEQTQNREHLRICGELITANLYRMERGAGRIKAENYYEEGCPTVEIHLDPRLSPQENAAKYFKQYTKAKTAEKMLTELLTKGRAELQYLESVVQELQLAESEQDFNDIRAELTEGGYLRQHGKKQSGFQRASRPREFRSTSGLRILVGRNNRQNDKLTGKDADKRDIWLHTQKIHGSHVILCTNGQEPDLQSLEEAACLAAYYSQGRESGKVAVDYTPVKFVKKPAGSRPGMVVYTTYRTMTVQPDGELVKKLSVK